MRSVSKKRAAEAPLRAECCRIVLERDKGCVFWRRVEASDLREDFPACSGMLEVHEPGRRRNTDYLSPADCVVLCSRHHAWVHAHPKISETLGLYVRSVGNPIRKGLT